MTRNKPILHPPGCRRPRNPGAICRFFFLNLRVPQLHLLLPAAADNVPEWMRSAGWQESDRAAQAGTPDSGESLPEEPIAKADIPDWLKSMAPTEAAEEANSEPEEPAEVLPVGEDGIPDWLKPTGSVASAGKCTIGSSATLKNLNAGQFSRCSGLAQCHGS